MNGHFAHRIEHPLIFGSGVTFQVYRNSPSSLVELNSIRHEFSCIQPEMLHAAVNYVITRLQNNICGDGGHMEQVR